MTLESQFMEWAAKSAANRVVDMGYRFMDNPELFCEAHDVELFDYQSMTPEKGFNVLMSMCCKIVAPEWSWAWNFNAVADATKFVWVRRIHG